MKPKIPFHIIKGLIIVLVSTMFTIATFVGVNSNHSKHSDEFILENVYTVAIEKRDQINKRANAVKYEVELYRNMESIKMMDKAKIANIMAFVRANKEIYKNIVIIDNKKNIIYGYLEEERKFLQSNEIENVINSDELILKTVKYDDTYYLDVYRSIVNSNENVGVIWIRVSLNNVNKTIDDIYLKKTECYILDRNGVMITESRFVPNAIGETQIDLKRLKVNIDYSKNIPYKDYRGIDVYGMYFSLDVDGWTLVVETDADSKAEEKNKDKNIGQIITVIEAIGIVAIQLYMRKKFDVDIDSKELKNIFNNYTNGNLSNEKLAENIANLFEKNNNKKNDK